MHSTSSVLPFATIAFSVVATLASAAIAQPQVAGAPVVVFQAGQRLVSTAPETTVTGFSSLVSDGSRIAANLTTEEGGAIVSFTPGSTVIQTRLRVGPSTSEASGHRRVKLENGFGIGASGALVVSSLTTAERPEEGSAYYGLLDTLWLAPSSGPGVLVAVRGGKLGLGSESYSWAFMSQPGATDTGIPYWVGGRSLSTATSVDDVSMYRGSGSQPERLIGSGSGVVGGMTLDGRRPLRMVRLTPSGTRIYGIFGLSSTPATDEFVGWREAQATSSLVRVLLREGSFVSGTEGERWRSFNRLAVTDKSLCPGTNEWAVLADTTAESHRNSVLVVNGEIVLREGDAIEGTTLFGAPGDLAMNRQGDWAVTWKVRSAGSGGTAWVDRTAMIVNGRIALVEQSAAVGGASITSLNASLCIGDRAMSGYVDVGVVGTILPSGSGATLTAAILSVHAMSGLAGCCPADLATGGYTVEEEEPDGQVTPADLALFISRYMASDPLADLDDGTGTGTPDGQFTEADLNYYLNHYFTGCLEEI